MFGIVETVLAVLLLVATAWGITGRGKAKRAGKREATEKITREIVEADHETREAIQKALTAHPATYDAALERLRKRLGDSE